MFDWSRAVRDKMFLSVLAVVGVAFVGIIVSAGWGPSTWVPVGVVLAVCLGGFARYRAVHASNVLAALDPYSFADALQSMRAKERARELLDIRRREELLEAK
jgi:hypothetical protein